VSVSVSVSVSLFLSVSFSPSLTNRPSQMHKSTHTKCTYRGQ